MKKILNIKHIKVFMALSMFLLVLSGTAAAAVVDTPVLFCKIGETRCCLAGRQACCVDNGSTYDVSCFDNSCDLAGATQKKYTASGCSYTTSTRTCCSNKTWSDWDTACPKTCNQSTKPSTSQSCYGGYKHRSVTCNDGNWVTSPWDDCDCSSPGFETVWLYGGHKCCQKSDGTGAQCKADPEQLQYTWKFMTTTCRTSCYASSLSGCGTCNSGNKGADCTVSGNAVSSFCDNRKECQLYRCQL